MRANFLLAFLWLAAASVGLAAPKQILIVSSYSPGYAWSLDVVSGMHEALREEAIEFVTTVEFLNSRRETKWEARFRARMAELKGEKQFDQLVLLDDEAVDLWCRDEGLFGKMPTIFAGIGQEPACKGEGRDATGVLEKFDVRGLLEFARAVRPNPKRIVIVGDKTATALYVRDLLWRSLPVEMRARVENIWGEETTLEAAERRLAGLEAESLVFLVSFVRDQKRDYLPPLSTNRRLGMASGAPVVALGNNASPGVLAGTRNLGLPYGRLVASVMTRVLRGESARTIPVREQLQYGPEVERSELERWKIDRARIPKDAAILHEQTSFFDQYRGWLMGGAVFVVLQMGLLLILGINVARRRQAQRSLRETNAKLEEQNANYREALQAAKEGAAAKDRFLANVSHELRTPLNGVLGMSDLLLAGSIESKERGYLETLRNSASHLLILLNDLLDLTRMESGRLIVVERPMRPEAIVREVLALAPNDNPRVTLRHRSAGQTPEWVVGDGARLRQIIFNLVGNAQKFTDVGWIEVTTQYENGWLDIQVEDTGAGIPEDMQESIFQRFVQVDESSTRKFGGLGLGLPIARELARRMKGELTVESQFGVGSRFRLRIPAPECAGAEVTTGYEPKPLADKRILLVEDNAVNRVVAQRMLERLGITVKLARNGREAVLACASETFELVLMDLQMPEMDGFAATREIRASGNEVPVVAVTASAMIGERERCLSAGMNDYLSKPIDRRALEEMLEKWLAADQGSTSSR